jgi:hypothetical protein
MAMASCAYSEHVGKKRQEGGKKGEIQMRYIFIRYNNIFFIMNSNPSSQLYVRDEADDLMNFSP